MDYDIASAFEDIEMSLIKSMRNNMKRHINEEYDEGINWTQWQAEMLSGLSQYRAENKDVLKGYMGRINAKLDEAIRDAYATGESEQEIELLKAIKRGYQAPKDGRKAKMQGRFFRNNQKKLNALVKSTTDDMKKAETALLRMTDDVYRKTLFKAQMFYNTGAGSMWQCIDMATKDFRAAGINCVQYKNGARVNIASYAEMALRTANKRANLMGQAQTREKWGVHTVKINYRGIACPICLQYLGQVYIDDVYGGGTYEESVQTGYPLLSTAVAGGLFHPNCKDACSTFYEGINRPPERPTPEQEAEIKRKYNLEQEQRYYERNYKKNMRMGNGCLDQQEAGKYFARASQYKNKLIELCDNNADVLRYDKARMSLRGVLSVDNAGRLSITPTAIKNANTGQIRNYNNELSTKLGKTHFDAMHDIIEKCEDAEVVSMWRAYEDSIKVGSTSENGAKASGKHIYINIDKVAKGSMIDKPYQVLFHECGHTIDTMARDKLKTTGVFARHFSGAYKDGLFPQTIKDEVQEWVKSHEVRLKKVFKDHAGDVEWFYKNGYISDWSYDLYKNGTFSADRVLPKYRKSMAYSAVEKELRAYDKIDVADLCDMVEGATNAKISCVAGHGKKYWSDRTIGGISDGLATEAFAEMTDSTMTNSKSLELIKKHLPKSYELYKEMVKEILKNG